MTTAAIDVMGLIRKADLYIQQRNLDKAEEILQQIVAANSRQPVALRMLGNIYYEDARFDEALEYYTRSMELRPSPALKLRTTLMVHPVAFTKQEILETRKTLSHAVDEMLNHMPPAGEGYKEFGQTNFYLSYHGYSNRELVAKIAQLYLKMYPSLAFEAPHCKNNIPIAGRLPKLCIVTTLHYKTVGKFMIGLIEKLAKHGFDVVVAVVDDGSSQSVSEDALRQIAQVVKLPYQYEAARQTLATLEADIMLYTDIGMHVFTYYLSFSRFAPVQCVLWGHPDTTGIPAIDYYISSSLIEPEGGQKHYSETLLCINELPTFYKKPQAPKLPKRSMFGLSEADNVYICPQTLFKFHPDFDEVLARILRKDPDAKLVVIDSLFVHWKDMLLARMRKTMPDVWGRVVFVPCLEQEAFFQLLLCADVMLDPLYFGGGNTTYEALAFGVPIVTLPGEFMRGRVTYGCYRRMGYEALVARNIDEYVDLSVRVGTDRVWRNNIRAEILERAGVLFENENAVSEIASLLYQQLKAKVDLS